MSIIIKVLLFLVGVLVIVFITAFFFFPLIRWMDKKDHRPENLEEVDPVEKAIIEWSDKILALFGK